MSVCRPVEIDAQPRACAAVGASKADSNQARTAGAKGASGSPGAGGSTAMGVVVTGRGILLRSHDFARMFGRLPRAVTPLGKGPFGPVSTIVRGAESQQDLTKVRCERSACDVGSSKVRRPTWLDRRGDRAVPLGPVRCDRAHVARAERLVVHDPLDRVLDPRDP